MRSTLLQNEKMRRDRLLFGVKQSGIKISFPQMLDEDTRESEALVVDDFIHDSPETLAVLETPGVEDAFSRAKKKPCLDDRDTDSSLDKDRDTMPGPDERSS